MRSSLQDLIVGRTSPPVHVGDPDEGERGMSKGIDRQMMGNRIRWQERGRDAGRRVAQGVALLPVVPGGGKAV